jgi:hypothetical protein
MTARISPPPPASCHCMRGRGVEAGGMGNHGRHSGEAERTLLAASEGTEPLPRQASVPRVRCSAQSGTQGRALVIQLAERGPLCGPMQFRAIRPAHIGPRWQCRFPPPPPTLPPRFFKLSFPDPSLQSLSRHYPSLALSSPYTGKLHLLHSGCAAFNKPQPHPAPCPTSRLPS